MEVQSVTVQVRHVGRAGGSSAVQISRGAGDGLPDGNPIFGNLPTDVERADAVVAGSEVIVRNKHAHRRFLADVPLNAQHAARSVIARARISEIDALARTTVGTRKESDGPASDSPRQ